MKKRIFFWSVTSALAGFLFGFDTVVISGAEQTIQSLWDLSAGTARCSRWAAALYGTVLGSLLGGWPTDRFGRKATLLWIGVLYLISAVGCGLADGCLLVHRRPLHRRPGHRHFHGRGPALHFGNCPARLSRTPGGHVSVQHRLRHLIAFVSNCAACRDRRECLALDAGGGGVSFPALRRAVLWHAGKPALAAGPERRPRGGPQGPATDRAASARRAQIEAEADEIIAASSRAGRRPAISGRGGCAFRSCSAFLIAFFNQLSGINAILYFAPRIFEMTGLGRRRPRCCNPSASA